MKFREKIIYFIWKYPELISHIFFEGTDTSKKTYQQVSELEDGYFRALGLTFIRELLQLDSKHQITLKYIQELHACCIGGVSLQNQDENLSEFKPISYFGIEIHLMQNAIKKNRCFNTLKDDPDRINKFYEIYFINSMDEVIDLDIEKVDEIPGNLRMLIHSGEDSPVTDNLSTIIADYYQELQNLDQNPLGIMRAIIRMIQRLERRHPFKDGNCRTFCMMLLNIELVKHSLPITLQDDPNYLDFFDINLSLRQVIQGQKRFINYVKEPYQAFSFSHIDGSSNLTNRARWYLQKAHIFDILSYIDELRPQKYLDMLQTMLRKNKINRSNMFEWIPSASHIIYISQQLAPEYKKKFYTFIKKNIDLFNAHDILKLFLIKSSQLDAIADELLAQVLSKNQCKDLSWDEYVFIYHNAGLINKILLVNNFPNLFQNNLFNQLSEFLNTIDLFSETEQSEIFEEIRDKLYDWIKTPEECLLLLKKNIIHPLKHQSLINAVIKKIFCGIKNEQIFINIACLVSHNTKHLMTELINPLTFIHFDINNINLFIQYVFEIFSPEDQIIVLNANRSEIFKFLIGNHYRLQLSIQEERLFKDYLDSFSFFSNLDSLVLFKTIVHKFKDQSIRKEIFNTIQTNPGLSHISEEMFLKDTHFKPINSTIYDAQPHELKWLLYRIEHNIDIEFFELAIIKKYLFSTLDDKVKDNLKYSLISKVQCVLHFNQLLSVFPNAPIDEFKKNISNHLCTSSDFKLAIEFLNHNEQEYIINVLDTKMNLLIRHFDDLMNVLFFLSYPLKEKTLLLIQSNLKSVIQTPNQLKKILENINTPLSFHITKKACEGRELFDNIFASNKSLVFFSTNSESKNCGLNIHKCQ